MDVNEQIMTNVPSARFVTWTFVTGLLVHIQQKENIAWEIAAKVYTGVKWLTGLIYTVRSTGEYRSLPVWWLPHIFINVYYLFCNDFISFNNLTWLWNLFWTSKLKIFSSWVDFKWWINSLIKVVEQFAWK